MPRPPMLDAVMTRLDRLASNPSFALQRELAMALALKPYRQGGADSVLAPLPQETDLATHMLYCDYYPDDGQLTLIEQVRDLVTEPVPPGERRWLDPLAQSHVDLLEVTGPSPSGDTLVYRSLGDDTGFILPGRDAAKDLRAGHVLLTRVIRDP